MNALKLYCFKIFSTILNWGRFDTEEKVFLEDLNLNWIHFHKPYQVGKSNCGSLKSWNFLCPLLKEFRTNHFEYFSERLIFDDLHIWASSIICKECKKTLLSNFVLGCSFKFNLFRSVNKNSRKCICCGVHNQKKFLLEILSKSSKVFLDRANNLKGK
jgi:hypothetical protein